MARDLAKRRAPGQESGASFDTAFDQEHEMSRPVLAEDRVHPAVKDRLGGKHKDLVAEVERAIEEHDVVVVGMSQNPHPRRACNVLKKRGVAHKYMQYGSYLSSWRQRLAFKMWTGWATFPMVFVKGTFIGGADDLAKLCESGELDRMLGKS
jgi:monothiol glutaredoxin